MLADPIRFHILCLLMGRSVYVGELVEETGASRTAVSQHLSKLRLAGLVVRRKDGRSASYALADQRLARLLTEGMNYADHRAGQAGKIKSL